DCETVGSQTVEVVGIDDGEGSRNRVARGEHRVHGSPGLCPRRRGKPGGQPRDILARPRYLEIGWKDARELRERIHQLPADDEDHALKARAAGVEYSVLEEHLACGADAIDLLETTVAQPESCGHDE